ncbi:MAG TPA: hypothetical protein DCP69_04975 [Candidatus Omnitrophica bacterium]|nr:hypothetical protein [Candidatus Omnitrophota bacterium]
MPDPRLQRIRAAYQALGASLDVAEALARSDIEIERTRVVVDDLVFQREDVACLRTQVGRLLDGRTWDERPTGRS